MSNWDVLIKVCNKSATKENKGDGNPVCEYQHKGSKHVYEAYLSTILDHNLRGHGIERKIVYWIKE